MTAATVDAQGHRHRRSQQDLRPRINADEGATWRMTAHDYGSRRARWGGARRPRGSMDPTSVSGMTLRRTPINSLVTGKSGDDGFNLIWSRHSAN